MRTRLLFLDDSGKPDPPHPSQVVAIAGFAIDSDLYPDFSRRVLGAKGRFFPSRGVPQAWELKSSRIIKPNPWKRAKNRAFCDELVRLIGVMGGSCFGATIDKRRLNHPMALSTTMPLQLQALVEHFDAECRCLGRMGMVVADWSSHQHDQHASQCVASFSASRQLAVHPGVYYASSHANEAIQVADLIAGVRRRAEEGDANLSVLDGKLQNLRRCSPAERTVMGRGFHNCIRLI